MTDPKEIIEIARALAEIREPGAWDQKDPDDPQDVFGSNRHWRNKYIADAHAFRRTLRDAGLVMVDPENPTHAMVKAASESRAVDDEGEFDSLGDLLNFSGENKTHTVIRAALRAAMIAAAEREGGSND